MTNYPLGNATTIIDIDLQVEKNFCTNLNHIRRVLFKPSAASHNYLNQQWENIVVSYKINSHLCYVLHTVGKDVGT